MKDDAVYLKHILECVRRIEETTSEGYKQFMSSHMHQDAVLRNPKTLAESTQQLSDELKSQYTSVEWRSISAFRNVLAHDYLGIDLDEIWKIVQEDVPRLKETIDQILEERNV